MQYMPDYHSLHKLDNVPLRQLDYKKMTFKQLTYGMTCIAQHVLATGGDTDGYLMHMEFVSCHASDNSFLDCAYNEYDRCVIDGYLKSPLLGFKTADSTAIGYAFHPGKLTHDYVDRSGASVKQRRRTVKKGTKSDVPDGYPEGNCFFGIIEIVITVLVQKNMSVEFVRGTIKRLDAPGEKNDFVL